MFDSIFGFVTNPNQADNEANQTINNGDIFYSFKV